MTRRGAWLAGPGICSATPGGPHRHDRDPAPLFRAHVWCPSADGEDYVGSLDDRGDLAALGQAELADGLHRDGGDQAHAVGLEFHVGDGLAAVDACHSRWDLVPRTELHDCDSQVMTGAACAQRGLSPTLSPVSPAPREASHRLVRRLAPESGLPGEAS